MKKLFAVFLSLFIAGAALAQSNPNMSVVLRPSAAATATYTGADQTNATWNSIHLTINISSYTSGTFTPRIQAKDPASNTYYDLLVGTALNSTGITVLKVGPGMSAIANSSSADFLPRTWRVVVTGAATPVATYSIGAFLVTQ